ncbi:hypothetical protein Pelo_11631 [Pelomyxa schiedti]|nr:hypothetical protein Pelo_11631 [Pelomyxa schiedti]
MKLLADALRTSSSFLQDINMNSLEQESQAVKAREVVCRAALASFIGEPSAESDMPCVAVCGSGGGVRAMVSMIAFLNGLSSIGLLDGITYCAGLSGSTWCLLQWIASSGNPFHSGQTEDDPWVLGGRYNSERHTHKGLVSMLKETKSSKWTPRLLVHLTHLLTLDTGFNTIAGAISMLSEGRGGSVMTAWAKFLANLMLKKALPDDVDPFSLRLSASAEKLLSGAYPIPICTAITESRPGTTSSSCDEQHSFSTAISTGTPPTGSVLSIPAIETTGSSLSSTSEAVNNPSVILPPLASISTRPTTVQSMECPEAAGKIGWDWVTITPFTVHKSGKYIKSTSQLHDDSIPHLMAVCGSAFAFDWRTHVLPTVQNMFPHVVQRMMPNEAWLDSTKPAIESFLGGATSTDPDVGNMRDAGIDFNVPFPAFVGRGVDVVIVMDASGGASGCEELRNAVDRGYVSVREADKILLSTKFDIKESVRVFFPGKQGDPVIIYFMGNTTINTACFEYDEARLRGVTETIRDTVKKEVETIRWAIHSRKKVKLPVLSFQPANPSATPIREKLRIHYKQFYSTMSFLAGDNSTISTDFERMFISNIKLSCISSNHALGIQYSISIDKLWEMARKEGKRLVVLEGIGGSGKSTLCKQLGRKQGLDNWTQFQAVIVVELGKFNALQLAPTEVQDLLVAIGISDPEVVGFIQGNSSNVLWIFDGFDELEQHSLSSGIQDWLSALRIGNVQWVEWAIFTSRNKGNLHTLFPQAMFTRIERWTMETVMLYIKQFFSTVDSNPQDQYWTVDKMQSIPDFFDFISIPLYCELACTLIKSLRRENPVGVTLKLFLKSLIEWLWQRMQNKNPLMDQNLFHTHKKEAMERLRELALKSYLHKQPTFTLKLGRKCDSFAFKSGLVSKSPSEECDVISPNPTVEFVHHMIGDYFLAKALWHAKTFNTEISLALEQRVLLIILVNIAQENKQSDAVFDIILTKFVNNLTQRTVEFEKNMDKSGRSYSTRVQWRANLYVDVVVELATLLGETATQKFIHSIAPSTMSKLIFRPPMIFHLLLEPAARYGNLLLLEDVMNRIGTADSNQALVEAYITGQQKVIHILQRKNVGEVSVSLPASIGSVVGVSAILNKQQQEDPSVVPRLISEALYSAVDQDQAEVVNFLLPQCTEKDLHTTAKQALLIGAERCAPILLGRITTIGFYRSESIQVSSYTLQQLAKFSAHRLTVVSLNNCTGITDRGFVSLLEASPSLSVLEVSYCVGLTDLTLCAIAKYCRQITALDLSGCTKISDYGVVEVAKSCNASLVVLFLNLCYRVTDAPFLEKGVIWHSLQHLDLSKCSISDKTVSVLPDICPCLRFLNLDWCNLTNEGVLRLCYLKTVEQLSLKNCRKVTLSTEDVISAAHAPEGGQILLDAAEEEGRISYSFEINGYLPILGVSIHLFALDYTDKIIAAHKFVTRSGCNSFCGLPDGFYHLNLVLQSKTIIQQRSEELFVGNFVPLTATLQDRNIIVSYEPEFHSSVPDMDWIAVYNKNEKNNRKYIIKKNRHSSQSSVILGPLPYVKGTQTYEARYFKFGCTVDTSVGGGSGGEVLIHSGRSNPVALPMSDCLSLSSPQDHIEYDHELVVTWELSSVQPHKSDWIGIYDGNGRCLCYQITSKGVVTPQGDLGNVTFTKADLKKVPPGQATIKYFSARTNTEILAVQVTLVE